VSQIELAQAERELAQAERELAQAERELAQAERSGAAHGFLDEGDDWRAHAEFADA